MRRVPSLFLTEECPMDANPEVMPAVAKAPTRQVPQPGLRDGQGEAMPKAIAVKRTGDSSRMSEDPMRRTDRYRLVMPWSLLP